MVTSAKPDAAETLRVLSSWSGALDIQDRVRQAINDVGAEVDRLVYADTSVRVPHRAEERTDGMKTWLAGAMRGS